MIETTNTDAILKMLRSGKEGRDNVIKILYYDVKFNDRVKSILFKYGGNNDDFDHVLNTVLMQFIKTVLKNNGLKIESSLYSYLGGITRFVVLNELKLKHKNPSEMLENQYDLSEEQTPESLLINQDKKDLIHILMGRIGKNCKEVLMHWANGYRMVKIAEMMNYKSEGMAKKKKHQCFKQLLEYLNDNPQIKSILR